MFDHLREGPRARGKVGRERGRLGADGQGLVTVNPKTGGRGKAIYHSHSLPEIKEVGGAEGNVVRTGVGGHLGVLRKPPKEDVVTHDKEEGGEGAALFDSPVDRDPPVFSPLEGGFDKHLMEKALDQPHEPIRHAETNKSLKDERVVYRVKGLGRVHKEDKKVFINRSGGVFNQTVKKLVDLVQVFFKHTPRDKALLSGVKMVVECEGMSTMRLSALVTEIGRVSKGRPFLRDEKEDRSCHPRGAAHR